MGLRFFSSLATVLQYWFLTFAIYYAIKVVPYKL